MSFPYKNPISPNQLSGQQSLERTKTYGTNYSVLSTGGYMEVYSLDQLYYTIPPSTYGPIEYSGNTIPITFSKGSGTTFSFDTLTLQPDNISSGRRKLGMLVYVYEENQIYQFLINNYETLWSAATGSTGTTVISDFGTTIKADSPENISFISAWTANTIEDVSGETSTTAVWKKYHGTNLALTGGSFNIFTGVLSLTNITGGTQFLSGFGSISGFTAAGAYGCFTDTTTQVVSAANTPTLWNINTTELSNGVYLSGGTKIRVTQYGIYNIAYSAQIERTSAAGGQADVTIWAKLNGNDIVRSSSTISLISNSAYQLPFVSYIVEMNQNDYLEFYFSSNSQYAQLTALSGLTSPTRPDAPSLIIVAQSVLGTTPAFTGNTSATCITDLYVENLYGCSPINVNDLLIGNSGITTTSLTANTISATTYLNLPTSPGGGISGSGTTNKIPKFTASTSIGNSIITDDGTNVTISGNEIVSGSFSGNVLFSTQSSGDEGGQLDLFVPQTNTTLSGTTISLDIYQNRFRIFESSSPNRGVYIDLSTTSNGVGTNLLSNSSFVQITANTTTTNLTYTDVAGLSITPSTTGVYEFIVVLFTGSDTAAGMRIGMSVPASSTNFYYMVQGVNSAAANQTFVEGAASGSLVTTFACNTFNGQTGVTKIDGIVTTTQSGEIKIGFAKITSGTATIRAGSYIRITKIA